MWLEDDDGNSAPHFNTDDEASKMIYETMVDSIIKGTTECNDPELEELLPLQHHSHTFTCYKKNRIVKIGAKDGHGRLDGVKDGPVIKARICRFMFPRPPVRETCVIIPPDQDTPENTVAVWKKNYKKIRSFLLRQTFKEYPGQVTEEIKIFSGLMLKLTSY